MLRLWRIGENTGSTGREKELQLTRELHTTFKNTRFYRTTRIFGGTHPFQLWNLDNGLSIPIYGYIFRLRNPVPGLEKPSVFTFVMLLLLGVTFFSISFIYLKAYLDTPGKKGKK